MGAAIAVGDQPRQTLLNRDERLARRAARGDQRAFAAIFERYHQDLYRYCHSILRDADDAQDALQNTMASALRALPGEEREIALRPWLFRVAHNHAVSIVRARRQGREELDLARVPDLRGAELPETRMRLRQLLADLATLPEGGRAALTMRELSGLSYEEIGQALGISPQAARQKVYEARVALLELEEGRAMRCEAVRQKLSDGDRRGLRARRVRAHLRDCAGCRDFRAAIDHRAADLAALSPPLPALAATVILHGVLGGGASAAGLGTAGAGAAASGVGAAAHGAGASLVVKGATTLAAAAALGAGAASYSGALKLPFAGGGDAAPAQSGGAAPEAAPAADPAGRSNATGDPAARATGAEPEGTGRSRQASGGSGGPQDAAASPSKGSQPAAAAPPHAEDPGPPAHASPGAPAPAAQPPAAQPEPEPPVPLSPATPPPAAGDAPGSPGAPPANAAPQAHGAVATAEGVRGRRSGTPRATSPDRP